MTSHALEIDCILLPSHSITLKYYDDEPCLSVRIHRFDNQGDRSESVDMDYEAARSTLMFIQQFLQDVSRKKQIKEHGKPFME
jgi:hypothetical protein